MVSDRFTRRDRERVNQIEISFGVDGKGTLNGRG